MEIKIIEIEKPDEMNFIFGMSHFIKTVEDIHEAIVQACSSIKFGLAFCEASGPRLVRVSGNKPELEKIAEKNAMNVGSGHSFIVFLEDGFPINILNAIKQVPEVCSIYCATANPTKIIIMEDGEGRGVIGAIDGFKPVGIETKEDVINRQEFLRMTGYKLG